MSKKARFTCWLKGHKVRSFEYVIPATDEKAYHGHAERRWYDGCSRCGKGTSKKELHYSDQKSIIERNAVLSFLVGVLVVVGIGIAVFAAFALFVGLGTLLLLPLMKYTCELNGAEMGLAAKYNYWTGCYFNVDGRWIADELLNVVDLLK